MSSTPLFRPDKAFPDHWRWRIFALPEIPENDLTGPFGTELETGGRRIAGQPLEFPPSGQILLSDFSGDAPAFLLVCDFTESEAGKAVIGVGADWSLVLKINGTVLCDTRKTGNGEVHYEADDHKQEFSYSAGANQLSMLVICGRSSRLAAARLFPVEHPALKHPPWCAFPDSRTGSVSIMFTTTLPCPAGIDLREKGSEEWRRVYDSTGGRINRRKTVHQIRLGGLAPDREYEYRTVLLDELVRWEATVGTEIHHFRTLPDTDRVFRFNFTADLQISLKNREYLYDAKRPAILEHHLGLGDFADVDKLTEKAVAILGDAYAALSRSDIIADVSDLSFVDLRTDEKFIAIDYKGFPVWIVPGLIYFREGAVSAINAEVRLTGDENSDDFFRRIGQLNSLFELFCRSRFPGYPVNITTFTFSKDLSSVVYNLFEPDIEKLIDASSAEMLALIDKDGLAHPEDFPPCENRAYCKTCRYQSACRLLENASVQDGAAR